MRLSTITNIAYVVTLVLTSVSATAFILAAQSASEERLAVQNHLELDGLAEDLALGAEVRTDEARLYVMRGDEQHLARFFVEEDHERNLEAAISNLDEDGVASNERAMFEKIRADAEALDKIERGAVTAFREGRNDDARAVLFGDEHYRVHTDLLQSVKDVRVAVSSRSQATVDAAKARSDLYSTIARVMLSLTALMFIAVLYFVLSRRVALPLIKMSDTVRRLARQEYDVEVPVESRRDEIGEMNQAIQIFRDNGLERERLDAERRKDQRVKDLILQMMHRVQACQNEEELSAAASLFMPQIFPDLPGQLAILGESGTILRVSGHWGATDSVVSSLAIDDCWALRRGRSHVSKPGEDMLCTHLGRSEANQLCIPLTALGEIVGLLTFEIPSGEVSKFEERIYLELLSENVGLAVANLQLRHRLVGLAKRDALTGLLNRRSLDEALNRLAAAPGISVACLMIDIDYFKRFNDQHGHDAGDAVMQYVGKIFVEVIRDSGEVYRFGGEEFTVLLPEADLRAATVMAERLRVAVQDAPLSHRGRLLEPISISLGVATAPVGGVVSTVLERADAALLVAKSSGRNRWTSSEVENLLS